MLGCVMWRSKSEICHETSMVRSYMIALLNVNNDNIIDSPWSEIQVFGRSDDNNCLKFLL